MTPLRPIRKDQTAYARTRLFVIFALIYGAFGVQSPFFSVFLQDRGFQVWTIGLLLAGSTVIKLISAPAVGRIADHYSALSPVLTMSLLGCGLASIGLVSAGHPAQMLTAIAALAVCLGPVPPLADAIALNTIGKTAYAPVRGAGAAAFIIGLTVSGRVVEQAGIASVFVINAILMVACASIAWKQIERREPALDPIMRSGHSEAVRYLLSIPTFRRVVVISALVLGSHALHDGFTVIRWTAAGMSPSTAGLLWSVAVGSEVVVFFFLGEPLLRVLGSRGACILAASVAALRWSIMAVTASTPVMVLVQPLHGLTFALLHLACMRLITETAPARFAATAQGAYGTLGPGLASVILTSASGYLYARLGAQAFWAMAILAIAGIVPACRLQRSD
ncbi:MAG: transporter [Hyphomicrobiales bacterium]|nr:transporter [Hyphomicrobiales bacterium]